MGNTWYSIDFETSDPNRYTCQIDRVCVAKFDIKTGEVEKEWDFRDPSRCIYAKELAHGLPSSDFMCVINSPCPKVMHNVGFDLYLMEERLSIPIKGPIHDTYMMAKHWRNDLPAYDLKSLAWYFEGDTYQPLLKLRKWIHDHNLKGEEDIDFDMTKPPDKLVHDYCIHDVKMTAKLASILYPKVKDNYAYQLDTDCLRINSKIEANGITIDVPYLKDFIRRGKRRIKRNRKQASSLLNVTDGRSPTGFALRDHLTKLGETEKTRTKMTKSDEATLKKWRNDETVRAVQRIRKDEKTVRTYAENILSVCGEGASFHPNLAQSAAITRRYKSFNLYGDNGVVAKGQVQNIPRGTGIRSAFIVPSGYAFVKLDLASIEARLGAHAMSVFLGEDWFCKQYRKSDKFNIYLFVVKSCSTGYKNVSKKDDIYQAYKHGCLGVQYGVGTDTFHKTLTDKFGLPYSHSECARIYQDIRTRFPVFGHLQRAVSKLIEDQGFILDDFGAIYYVPQKERYKGVSYYCQGCAGNVFKWWLRELKFGNGDYPFALVHDEIDMAVKRDRTARSRVKGYCDVLKKLDIFELPITAEASGLCQNWAEAG